MSSVFFYGTLCHAPLLSAVLGRDISNHDLIAARLPGYAVSWAKDGDYPLIYQSQGQYAQGILLRGLTQDDQDRLSFYEGGYGYALMPMRVLTDDSNGSKPAEEETQVYMPPADLLPGRDWVLSDWCREWGAITVDGAKEFMRQYGKISQERARLVWPYVLARAWSRHMAQQGAPTTRRSNNGWNDLTYHPRPGEGYDGFFGLHSFDVEYRQFNGGMSAPIRREGFVAFDAALVLPYDPVRDRVLFVEQFRYGPLLRRDPHPWVFEPVAGLVDAGEAPETCARREAEEEAGVTLTHLELMLKVYASPGYSSEYFHCFVGLTDLADGDGRIGGLDHENEDIRSHVLALDDAMGLVKSGEINAGPLVMMLLWLERERPRLRALG